MVKHQLRIFSVMAVIAILVVSVAGVFAQEGQTGADVVDEVIEEILEEVKGVSNETAIYVEKFLEETEVVDDVEDIESIEQIDLENPPEGVQVENVEDTDIAIYEVNYTEGPFDRNVFVVTFASDKFVSPIDIQRAAAVEYLHFGEDGVAEDSRYLKTATGVRSSADQGYVMMEEGSIVGLSTSAEVLRAVEGGRIDVIVYKNGEDTGFRNLIEATESGVEKDYDTQASGIIEFVPGDVISVYVDIHDSNVAWSDVITMVKVELP